MGAVGGGQTGIYVHRYTFRTGTNIKCVASVVEESAAGHMIIINEHLIGRVEQKTINQHIGNKHGFYCRCHRSQSIQG